ncbi:MAG: 2-phospho-L-lactate transferase CofD family protein [Candidatus Electrothrix aestuarii]|uniref:2-phospho-L-lactate transferase CofD family protein n=1 Tax=Candidatus Electrothrix aestuarii TaxID=3062594 RepID=A0AAU8LVM5_9BACT|nr:2-phospho-L-lactate transferase CofD family protein [Candidatus Electrothrix aestuarii]
MENGTHIPLGELLAGVTKKVFSPLDFMGKGTLAERVLAFALGEAPPHDVPGCTQEDWRRLAAGLGHVDVENVRVVVLGGGTGLSNVVGGDSRRADWKEAPFTGLKEVFPRLHSIVCVTDDGGSTGEMLKDFPLIGLGDLRHVLLASIRSANLKEQYQLDDAAALDTAAALHGFFNFRFNTPPESAAHLWAESGVSPEMFPRPLADYLVDLVQRLLADERMTAALRRPQCLGNLLLAAAVYGKLPAFFRTAELAANQKRIQTAIMDGLADLAQAVGAGSRAVLPCTATPSQLQLLYANGVLVTGERKAGEARRGYPVERTMVRFADEPLLPEAVSQSIAEADIIILAPGSLYSSIIPILQVPGVADLIRQNEKALKLLVANIWVQKGETDATREAPEKRFYASDLIRAYGHNISGGIQGLFSHVLTLDLADIPGSVLQNYILEKKEPIYVDSEKVRELGFEPVRACIFSRNLLQRQRVIQHDPNALALVVRSLWGLRESGYLALPAPAEVSLRGPEFSVRIAPDKLIPCMRYERIARAIEGLEFRYLTLDSDLPENMASSLRQNIAAAVLEILWRHPDIHPDHLQYLRGICLVETSSWKRCQQWDNVFSFYDPEDSCIKIRQDQNDAPERLEAALLIALGQSLLGNYCQEKGMEDVFVQERQVGRLYRLVTRTRQELKCFLSPEELDTYLQLSRMRPVEGERHCYTRLVNGEEGFTPPGLLFGLVFAWYLDNRFVSNVEYKMSVMKNILSDLIPEQVRILRRREELISFFRERIFRDQFFS